MHRSTRLLTVLGTFLPVLLGAAPVAEQPVSDADRREITRTLTALEQKWTGVWATRDVSVMSVLLAADFVATTATGELRTKQQHIAAYARDVKAFSGSVNTEVSVHVLTTSAAVITGLDTVRGRTPEGAEAVERYRWTDTWLFRNGLWQCVATHETGLK
jgi:hypothetical protein